jgi:hypothetical protein
LNASPEPALPKTRNSIRAPRSQAAGATTGVAISASTTISILASWICSVAAAHARTKRVVASFRDRIPVAQSSALWMWSADWLYRFGDLRWIPNSKYRDHDAEHPSGVVPADLTSGFDHTANSIHGPLIPIKIVGIKAGVRMAGSISFLPAREMRQS